MLNQEELKEILNYNSETGIFTWLVDRGTRARKGYDAGSYDKDGYVIITINKKKYFAHRLSWLYMTGEFPKDQIDHINSIKNCNIWSNLRVATRSQNKMNQGKNKNCKSGFKGIHYRKDLNKWISQIYINKKKHYLGYFNTPEEASLAYQKAAKEHHGDFYFEKRKK